jgi:hypothetical protein
MSRDWRLPAAYDYAYELPRPGWTWEFLRRNPRYEAEPKQAEAALPPAPDSDNDDEPPDAGRRWGLMFRATG